MKNYKNLNFAFLLFAGALLFTACGSPVEHNPEEEIILTAEDFKVSTFAAEVDEDVVMLRGSFDVDENKVSQELKWGFLWRLSSENDSAMRKIIVGRGFEGTEFRLNKDDFPRGVEVMVCAFVETQLTENAEITQMPGEEVWFDF